MNVEQYIRFAYHHAYRLVRRYSLRTIDVHDLAQIGLLQLLEVQDRFDASRGSEGAFANIVLRRAMQQYLISWSTYRKHFVPSIHIDTRAAHDVDPIDRVDAQRIYDRADSRDRDLIESYCRHDQSMQEIGESKACSKQRVSQKFRRMQKRYT